MCLIRFVDLTVKIIRKNFVLEFKGNVIKLGYSIERQYTLAVYIYERI